MIHVDPQPEYADFDVQVRKPGWIFLASTPNPTSREFDGHAYWTRSRAELRRAYLRCAYTSLWLAGNDVSVDHFLPKGKYPQFAYEWDNYRLARPKLNSRKGNSEDVVDPFSVQDGWFALECPSCLIFAGDELDSTVRQDVQTTISVLGLNKPDLVSERQDSLEDVAKGNVTLSHLDWHYPFLSYEVRRQGLEGQLENLFFS